MRLQKETFNIHYATRFFGEECSTKQIQKQRKNKKTLTRWKQKKNKKNDHTRETKKQKKQQTSVNTMEGNQKTKNKFDHMEVFDKVLDTSYPQKVPL